MGFLDHSTNNIVVDAVLTDKGRQLISEGNLDINGYVFYDDEVDYTLIQKYGRVIGKEKIEKNTPVFEASTNNSYGVKYALTDGQGQEFLGSLPWTAAATESTIRSSSSSSSYPTSSDIVITVAQADLDKASNGIVSEPGSVMVTYDSRFLSTSSTELQLGNWTSLSHTYYTFTAKDSGASLTQYHQNGAVKVPVTISTEYGFSKTVYITVQY